jgi:hypothetical protein
VNFYLLMKTGVFSLSLVEKRKEATLWGFCRLPNLLRSFAPETAFAPHEHTVLGFSVSDVTAAVKALREKDVTCNIYKGFNQDDLGIFSLPDSPLRVAWFNDADGNVLSVTNT